MASAHVILKYINQTKIKGGCQSGRKVVPHDSKSVLPLSSGWYVKFKLVYVHFLDFQTIITYVLL